MTLHSRAMQFLAAMASLGHLATRRQLSALGFGRRTVDRAINSGELLPVRPGWVATPEANRIAVIAVLHGARLTGTTALRSFGVWAGLDKAVHLQVPPTSHRTSYLSLTPINRFTSPEFDPGPVTLEWVAVTRPPAQLPQWRVPLPDALVRFARRESDEQVAAALESAIQEKRMRRAELNDLFERLPRRFRRILGRLNFLAESGLETIGRLRFEDHGFDVSQQVTIGPDRVDIVLDSWLIIELDGDAYHHVARDRARTNRLLRAGYTVLRFGYVDLFFEWDAMIALVNQVCGQSASAGEAASASTRF